MTTSAKTARSRDAVEAKLVTEERQEREVGTHPTRRTGRGAPGRCRRGGAMALRHPRSSACPGQRFGREPAQMATATTLIYAAAAIQIVG